MGKNLSSPVAFFFFCLLSLLVGVVIFFAFLDNTELSKREARKREATEQIAAWSKKVEKGGVLTPSEVAVIEETGDISKSPSWSYMEILYTSLKNEINTWTDERAKLAAEVENPSKTGLIMSAKEYKKLTDKETYAPTLKKWEEFGNDPSKWKVTEEGAYTTFEKEEQGTLNGMPIVNKSSFTIPNDLRDRFLSLYGKTTL